jgi:hypothetical protein
MALDIAGAVITFLAAGVGAWFLGPYLVTADFSGLDPDITEAWR